MSEVLVLVEHSAGEVKKVTNELLTAAATLGEPAAVVVATPGTAGGLKDRLAAYGAAKVYLAESAEVDQYLTAPAVGVLAALVDSAHPAAILIAASPDGKEIAGKLAVGCSPTPSSSPVMAPPPIRCSAAPTWPSPVPRHQPW